MTSTISAPGLGSCDGGLVIDLSRMRGVRVDPAVWLGLSFRRNRHPMKPSDLSQVATTLSVLAAVVFFAACGSSGATAPNTGGATACGTNCTADAAASSNKYVAMGDSFAAGPMIPDTVPGQSCGRSTHNYAHLVAAEVGLDLTDVSCIGATIDNITDTPQSMNPLQIGAVTPDVRVITITIGGNDVNYSASFVACGSDGMNGKSCLVASPDATAPDVDSAAIDILLDQVENKLVVMLGRVKQAAPAARIYLVAYPMILPDPAVPCPPDVPMQAADATFLAQVGSRLQAAFSSAATTAGVNFVDVYGPSHGHDACAPADQRWVEGQANPAVAAYHPNAAGMRAEADLIVTAIQEGAP